MPEDTPITPSVDAIVAEPHLYGFVWYTDDVEKGGRTFKGAQLVKHVDVDLLRKTFGDTFFTASMDGTSRHVTNQRINRDAWWNALGETPSRNVTTDELRRLVVENMLGMKTARRRTVIIETKEVPTEGYGALDGKVYPTQREAQEASMAWFVDQQPSREQA